MPGGHTGTDKPNLTACPAFLPAIRGPKMDDALANTNMAPFSDECKSVQGLYERFGGKCVTLYPSKRFK